MTLEQIRQALNPYFYSTEEDGIGLEAILKLVEEYAEQAYQDGFEQGWEENDFH